MAQLGEEPPARGIGTDIEAMLRSAVPHDEATAVAAQAAEEAMSVAEAHTTTTGMNVCNAPLALHVAVELGQHASVDATPRGVAAAVATRATAVFLVVATTPATPAAVQTTQATRATVAGEVLDALGPSAKVPLSAAQVGAAVVRATVTARAEDALLVRGVAPADTVDTQAAAPLEATAESARADLLLPPSPPRAARRPSSCAARSR